MTSGALFTISIYFSDFFFTIKVPPIRQKVKNENINMKTLNSELYNAKAYIIGLEVK